MLHNAKTIQLEEDLICYKIFVKDKITGRLFTLFYRTKVNKNITERAIASARNYVENYTNNILRRYGKHSVEIGYSNFYESFCVYSGTFHSFAKEQDAVHYLKNIIPHLRSDFINEGETAVIYKCRIPKESTVVFEGKYDIDRNSLIKSYASSDLIIEEELTYSPR